MNHTELDQITKALTTQFPDLIFKCRHMKGEKPAVTVTGDKIVVCTINEVHSYVFQYYETKGFHRPWLSSVTCRLGDDLHIYNGGHAWNTRSPKTRKILTCNAKTQTKEVVVLEFELRKYRT